MASILGIGECMVELSPAGDGLWRQGFAGDVFNTLWYARALSGADVSIAFHTAVGTDPLSDDLISFVEAAGITCEDTPRLPDRRPGLYSIHLKGAERSFTYWRDTSAARKLMQYPEQLGPKIAAADVIYFSGITLAILGETDCEAFAAALQNHKSDSALIAFDPNIRPQLWADKSRMRDVISEFAGISDIVLPSFEDEATTFGDPSPAKTAQRYQDLGAGHVVVKNGPAPTVHLQAGVLTEFPVAPVSGVTDTTAAGDSFNGAYMAALLSGSSVADAVAKAQSTAGMVVTHKGALVPFSQFAVLQHHQ